jgi:hypothetical protein
MFHKAIHIALNLIIISHTSVKTQYSPGVPAAASSPKLPESSRHDRKLTKDISNKVKRPIRVLNINFQSVCNNKSDLEEIINSTKPDIITDKETWLNSYNYLFCSSDIYFRPDNLIIGL